MCDKNVELVPPAYEVCRFVFTKKHYSKDRSMLRHQAFKPPKDFPNEISVYDINKLDENSIWKIGDENVAPTRGKIVARGDLLVSEINKINNKSNGKNLYVERDKIPHPLHANIKNLETKMGKQKVIAIKLAQATIGKLHINKHKK